MFSIFKKKKLSQEQLSQLFVNTIISLVDEGYDDVVEIIKNDPEFISIPEIDENHINEFLLIVISGNLWRLNESFNTIEGSKIKESITRKLSQALKVEPQFLKEQIAKYQSWMSQINRPSKNVVYAMSKAIFFKYDLNQYQSDYFKHMNAPNPIFLKRLDEIVTQFLFDWSEIQDQFRIVS